MSFKKLLVLYAFVAMFTLAQAAPKGGAFDAFVDKVAYKTDRSPEEVRKAAFEILRTELLFTSAELRRIGREDTTSRAIEHDAIQHLILSQSFHVKSGLFAARATELDASVGSAFEAMKEPKGAAEPYVMGMGPNWPTSKLSARATAELNKADVADGGQVLIESISIADRFKNDEIANKLLHTALERGRALVTGSTKKVSGKGKNAYARPVKNLDEAIGRIADNVTEYWDLAIKDQASKRAATVMALKKITASMGLTNKNTQLVAGFLIPSSPDEPSASVSILINKNTGEAVGVYVQDRLVK